MTEIIITSSILILIVLALRFLLRNKLSPTIIYAMWAIVALRLLLPFSIAETRLSVMNLFEHQETIDEPIDIEQTFQSVPDYMLNGDNPYVGTDWNPEELPYVEYEIVQNEHNGNVDNTRVDNGVTKKESPETKDILLAVWLTGAVGVLGYALFSNLTFWLRLKNSRELLYENTFLPVYIAEGISTPCLFGMIRPGIYLNEFAACDRQRAEYIINHEYIHYAHRDHIWAAVRVLCVSVYWFNPLVWIAASLSRQDSELACDSAVVKAIGEEHRLDYGRTLVDMMGVRYAPANVTLTVTSMNSGAKSIKERISTICRNPKTLLWSAIIVCVVIVAAFVVTFTGAAKKSAEDVASDTDVPSASDVLSQSDVEKVTYNIPPEELPALITFNIYNSDKLEDGMVQFRNAWTLKDRDLIASALSMDKLTEVKPEEIPFDSVMNAHVVIETTHHYSITNDGYVIYCKNSGGVPDGTEKVTINTDNLATGEYYKGYYGFYKMKMDDYNRFYEMLHGIVERHPLLHERLELNWTPTHVSVMFFDGHGSNLNAPVDTYESETTYTNQRIMHWLRTSEWQEIELNDIPAESKVIACVNSEDKDIFIITSDGYGIWKHDAYYVENSADLLYLNEGAPNNLANDYFYKGYSGAYRLPDNAVETILYILEESRPLDEAYFSQENIVTQLLQSGTCRIKYLDESAMLDSEERIEAALLGIDAHGIRSLQPFESHMAEGKQIYDQFTFTQTDSNAQTAGVSVMIGFYTNGVGCMRICQGEERTELKVITQPPYWGTLHYSFTDWISDGREYPSDIFELEMLFGGDFVVESDYYNCSGEFARKGNNFSEIWELLSDTSSWEKVFMNPDLDETDGRIMHIHSNDHYTPYNTEAKIYAESGYVWVSFKNENGGSWYRVPEGLDSLCRKIAKVVNNA